MLAILFFLWSTYFNIHQPGGEMKKNAIEVPVMIPRGGHVNHGSRYAARPGSSGLSSQEYTEKEKRFGVMVNVRLTVDEHMDLRRISYKERVSISSYIRKALFDDDRTRR